MDIEWYPPKARWNRAVELAYAAEEFENRLESGYIPTAEIRDRLTGPYISCLLSGEIEKALIAEDNRDEGEYRLSIVPKEKFLKTLRVLAGKLIGPESGIKDPYAPPRSDSK